MTARYLLSFLLFYALGFAAQPVDVIPARLSEGAVALSGWWNFKYVAGLNAGADEDFARPDFPVSSWKNITVPGHWELQGFAVPRYADDLAEGLGLYRRNFKVSPEWRGQRVYLRFDGVLFGFKVWVNGRAVGEWASGYNPATFDITDALRTDGGENVLAVRVTTRNREWGFDVMDCWSLAGIYRDVTLFARPELHLVDYTSRTTLRPGGGADLDLEFVASRAATVTGRVVAPDGTEVQKFETQLGAQGRGAIRVVVPQAKLWTAETPWLYQLEVNLRAGSDSVQHFSDRIGLRQVTIEGGVLKLNGVPIKLRGIDHHDIWPEEGRVATEARMRRDLELMREANINFIRTSHYPPHPRFLELCDEMGFYVDCEVPFIHGRKNLSDPSFQEALYTRARATVMRDKNRASIILWSLGNENHVNDLGLNAGRKVKELDPTRPITFPTMGSHFRGNYQLYPEFVDLYSPHYPSAGTVRDYAEKLTRPIVITEYAHQRGLSRGGAGVQEIWEAIWSSPRVAGGAIWMFQDQGILRRSDDPARVVNGDLMVWLDREHYYDTNGYYGVDGIVFSDRTPQTDFWQVRKVYSPVQLNADSLRVKPGANRITLKVENRHDFRTLTGLELHWVLRQNRDSRREGTVALAAPARGTETVTVDVELPAELADDVYVLEVQCRDASGRSLHERALRLQPVATKVKRGSLLQEALPRSALDLQTGADAFVVRHADWSLTLDRRTGRTHLVGRGGETLFSALGPHTGRKLTINDLGKRREGVATHWAGELLDEVAGLKTSAEKVADGIVLKVGGRFPRPGVPDQAVEGECELWASPSGAIKVSYRYAPVNAKDAMVEAGLAMALPAALSEFRWLGQGPYAGYPGKDRLNEYGVFHLNREDLYFPGNRRGVELALLATPGGQGLLLAADEAVISVEHRGDVTILSHLISAPTKASKGTAKEGKDAGENVENKAEFNPSSVKAIAGQFTLLPIGADWPVPLRRWFGSPAERVEVKRPFLRVYDQ